MLSLAGNTARLWRYKILYDRASEYEPDETEEANGDCTQKKALHNCIEYAHDDKEAIELSSQYNDAIIIPIDTNSHEWIDGMEFPTREEAMEALELGEIKYRELQFEKDEEYQNALTLVDLSFRLSKLELGV